MLWYVRRKVPFSFHTYVMVSRVAMGNQTNSACARLTTLEI